MLRPYDDTETDLRYDQVHEFIGNHNLFYDALAVYVLGYRWYGESLRD